MNTPKYKVGDIVEFGGQLGVIREVFFSDGSSSAFAPKDVWRYRMEDCADSFAPVEELLTLREVRV